MDRRKFLANGIIAGGAMALGTVAQAETKTGGKVRVIGISCSPRKGMTTATGVQVALDAAKEVDGRVQTELLVFANCFDIRVDMLPDPNIFVASLFVRTEIVRFSFNLLTVLSRWMKRKWEFV